VDADGSDEESLRVRNAGNGEVEGDFLVTVGHGLAIGELDTYGRTGLGF
jgi:hypothetical protein